MDTEEFEGICKNKRATKRANASKASNLVLMPWEKRHQHTMVRFLERTPSRTPSPQTFVKVDQNYANSTLEQNPHSDNCKRTIACSGKFANENAEEDIKINQLQHNASNRNDNHDSLHQNHDYGASKSKGRGTLASSYKVKPLQLLDAQMSAASKDTTQVKGGTAETKCESLALQDLSTYKTYQEQKHKFNGNKFIENYSKRRCTSYTTTSGHGAKYNLDELFRYQCPKNRRPLKEKLEFRISPPQNINSKHSNEEKNLAFPRNFEYLAEYNMEEVFKYEKCKPGKPVWQILGQFY